MADNVEESSALRTERPTDASFKASVATPTRQTANAGMEVRGSDVLVVSVVAIVAFVFLAWLNRPGAGTRQASRGRGVR